MKQKNSEFSVNERSYRIAVTPIVVICLDGCEPDYLDVALAQNKMPALQRVMEKGVSHLAHSVIPSFTNPNNMSIATGRTPSVHGICGNFLYDTATDEEVMMNDPRFLRAPTIFSAYYEQGAKVAIVTAKDKLRALLGEGLCFDENRAICFSSECADATELATHGIDNAATWLEEKVPNVYSAALSEFVFAAGVKLLREFAPNIMYLSTTDYIQHKHAPEAAEAIAFYAMFDKYLGELDTLGATVVITADHGMKAKHGDDGTPNVLYVQDVLDRLIGSEKARVILPITDPYVVHHGALGSFATAYLPAECSREAIVKQLQAQPEIELVLTREQAVEQFELPHDRIGDIVMLSKSDMTLGTSLARHDLAALKEPLRSHGGLSEQTVPFIINKPLSELPEAPELRNFDAFYYASMAAN